jgi:phosphate transport system protein
MAETGRKMLRAAISAYLARDAQAARNAAALEDAIDAGHKDLTEAVLGLMQERPGMIKKAVRILNTSNRLERIGDHITNICEAVIYMTEGRHEELNE